VRRGGAVESDEVGPSGGGLAGGLGEALEVTEEGEEGGRVSGLASGAQLFPAVQAGVGGGGEGRGRARLRNDLNDEGPGFSDLDHSTAHVGGDVGERRSLAQCDGGGLELGEPAADEAAPLLEDESGGSCAQALERLVAEVGPAGVNVHRQQTTHRDEQGVGPPGPSEFRGVGVEVGHQGRERGVGGLEGEESLEERRAGDTRPRGVVLDHLAQDGGGTELRSDACVQSNCDGERNAPESAPEVERRVGGGAHQGVPSGGGEGELLGRGGDVGLDLEPERGVASLGAEGRGGRLRRRQRRAGGAGRAGTVGSLGRGDGAAALGAGRG